MKQKNILILLIGIILGSTITVGASTLLNANEIDYENESLTSTNVQDAIDEVFDLTQQGDAELTDLLLGKTALVNGSLLTGTMPNNAAWTSNPTTSTKVTIPAGYHNGSGYVNTSGVWNAAVTAADARVNTSSTNYKSGYNAGVAAGGSLTYQTLATKAQSYTTTKAYKYIVVFGVTWSNYGSGDDSSTYTNVSIGYSAGTAVYNSDSILSLNTYASSAQRVVVLKDVPSGTSLTVAGRCIGGNKALYAVGFY